MKKSALVTRLVRLGKIPIAAAVAALGIFMVKAKIPIAPGEAVFSLTDFKKSLNKKIISYENSHYPEKKMPKPKRYEYFKVGGRKTKLFFLNRNIKLCFQNTFFVV